MVFHVNMKVRRPWGYYQTLAKAPGWQLKILVVNPKQAFSLQAHKHREEHWTIADGVGLVTVGNKTYRVKKGQRVFVRKGQKHRMANPSKTKPVTIVEVQFGKIIREDDIIRYEDKYGRA